MRVDYETSVPFQGDREAAIQRAAEAFRRNEFNVTMTRAGDGFEAVNTRSMFSSKKTANSGIARAAVTTIGSSLQAQAEYVDLSKLWLAIGLFSLTTAIGLAVLLYSLFWKEQPLLMLVPVLLLMDLPLLLVAVKIQNAQNKKAVDNLMKSV